MLTQAQTPRVVRATFSTALLLEELTDTMHYQIHSEAGVPVSVVSAAPVLVTVGSGSDGSVTAVGFESPGATFSSSDVGGYLDVGAGQNSARLVRITSVVSTTEVRTSPPLVQDETLSGGLTYTHYQGVTSVDLHLDGPTSQGHTYLVRAFPMRDALGALRPGEEATFVGLGETPQVLGVLFEPSNGSLRVEFDTHLNWGGPENYSISGPTLVTVREVRAHGQTSVVLTTSGFGPGSYTLTITGLGPLTGGTQVFASNTPEVSRSIYTDMGPIAKPPLVIQQGSGATLLTYVSPTFGAAHPFTSNVVDATGAAFLPEHEGLDFVLSGTERNDGTYKVLSCVSDTSVKLNASFQLPDAQNGHGTWTLVDPRDGQIADAPEDVTVRVNGVPVQPERVVGLRGQILLSYAPVHGDTVEVDYSWIPNPTVPFAALNDHAYVLNHWPTPVSQPLTQHVYPYHLGLVSPGDVGSSLPQPVLRDVYYRAFERAYTAGLNDPTLLRLNTPHHRVSYPQLSRQVKGESVAYLGNTLPESTLPGWTRVGGGSAVVSGGSLTVIDDSTGEYPTGHPIFWTRSVDLTFDHVIAATWRMSITSVSALDGVFTGVCFGWSDGSRAAVIGFLLENGVRKVGILKQGAGSNPSLPSAWTGTEVGAAAFDWSLLHSYRLFRGLDGVTKFFVDGETVPLLQVAEEDLPYLEELAAPFEQVQNVFFGSISRPGKSESRWDFLRYVTLPTNPEQTSGSISVLYGGGTSPENATDAWTPIGSHGVESLLPNGALILDSTSATDRVGLGAVGGDYRGYTRIEPLLSGVANSVTDFVLQGRTWTHGIAPNAITVAIDDSRYLTQISFLSLERSPSMSYPGTSLPEHVTPTVWQAMGGVVPTLVGGQLHIEDSSASDGIIYYTVDASLPDDAGRVWGSQLSSVLEARLQVDSYSQDSQGFCGITLNAFDGQRDLGLALMDDGQRKIALHSEGVFFGPSFTFDWFDYKPHTLRMVKSVSLGDLVYSGYTGVPTGTTLLDSVDFVSEGVQAGDLLYIASGGSSGIYRIGGVAGGSLTLLDDVPPTALAMYEVRRNYSATVALFVDNVYQGLADYFDFLPGVGVPMVAFGTSTPLSMGATVSSDIQYVNSWGKLETPKFVGIRNGGDPSTLHGYHLPLKASGGGAVDLGVLTDTEADFVASGVQVGDLVLVDTGTNQGVYHVTAVTPTFIDVTPTFSSSPSEVQYRIPRTTDWTSLRTYRVLRDPAGWVSLFVDGVLDIQVPYGNGSLPTSSSGFPYLIHGALASITWGAFDASALSQVRWDSVQYLLTRHPTSNSRVPHHHLLNQVNVMASPEHLTGTTTHEHTSYSSSSTGVPYPWEEYVSRAPTAHTRIGEGVPLMPSTQTYEVRRPTPIFSSVGGIAAQDFLEGSEFSATTKVTLAIPDDVIYDQLQVVEKVEGEEGLLSTLQEYPPFGQSLEYQKDTCMTYVGQDVPENVLLPTPWVLEATAGADYTASVSGGVLTLAIGAGGGQVTYRNDTPLTHSSLDTEVSFRVKVAQDGSGHTGDTGVRLGVEAWGLRAALIFKTNTAGDPEVQLFDVQGVEVLGALVFDYLDGEYHTYRLTRNVGAGTLDLEIEP